jgi:hypothetical protein
MQLFEQHGFAMGKASIDFSDPGILGKACDERLSVG